MPTRFIGTYAETNGDAYENLIKPNTPSADGVSNWNLTSFTEELFSQKEFKNKLNGKSFNLVLTEEFESDKFQNTLDENDNPNKKIGFFHVDTYQSVDKMISGEELIIITLSLIYAEIGEESNRVANNNFEVRYTNGVTLDGILQISPNDVDKDTKIQNAYRKFYKKALARLLDVITKDGNSKEISSFSQSDDIYFSIGKVIIGKKAKELANKVYSSEELIKTQILMLLQENLIKEIRKETALDSVVLLYPDTLNDIIIRDWERYLERMNEIFPEGSKNNDAEVSVRSIQPSCDRENINSTREIALDGYLIELFVSELYDKVTEKEDVDSVHAIQASMVSRIIIPLRKKEKIDGLSLPLKVLQPKKLTSAQSHEGYVLENSFSDVRTDKVATLIRKPVEEISPKLVTMIKDIVKLRETEDILYLDYKDFCQ